jgi:hypothetical protein
MSGTHAATWWQNLATDLTTFSIKSLSSSPLVASWHPSPDAGPAIAGG